MLKTLKKWAAPALGLLGLGASSASYAVIDYTPLTTAFDFGDVTTVMIGIAAVVLGVIVTVKGIGFVFQIGKKG